MSALRGRDEATYGRRREGVQMEVFDLFPADLGWSDLGTWSSLYTYLDLDKNQNAVQGNNVFLYDSGDNIVKMSNEKLVVLQGLNGYIIVENDGILLVCKKEDEQQIKKFVADVKKKNK